MKRCSKCKEEKLLSEFYADKRASDKLSSCCNKCQNKATIASRNKNKEKWHNYMKEYDNNRKNKKQSYYFKNKERFISYRLRKKFGITFDDYNKMLINQNNLCAICNCPETALDNYSNNIRAMTVDHNHKTGKIRGLLCMKCNRCLGLLKDDIEILKSAINYLLKEK